MAPLLTEGEFQLLIVADDLTGACDSGLALQQRGLPTEVQLSPFVVHSSMSGSRAVAFAAESRNVPEAEAVRRQQVAYAAAAKQAVGTTTVVWYKKIDSLLRGHPVAELKAMLSTSSQWAVLAPALPSAGRTTVGGYQLLNGLPVTCALAPDTHAPCPNAHLPSLLTTHDLAHGCVALADLSLGTAKVAALMQQAVGGGAKCVVCDASTDNELEVIANAACMAAKTLGSLPLFVGTSGLAAALPKALGVGTLKQTQAVPGRWSPSAGAPVVVVSGSAQELTKRQLEHLNEVEVVRGCDNKDQSAQPPNQCEPGGAMPTVLLADGADGGPQAAAIAVSKSKSALLPCNSTCTGPALGAVVTGGETASLLLQALEATSLRMVGQVSPAVPLLRVSGGPCDGMPLVTKSGALGELSAFSDAARAIRNLGDVFVNGALVKPSSPSANVDPGSEGLPLLAITMGDPCGVGPEIIAKVLAKPETHRLARFVVIGSPEWMERGIAFVGGSLTVRSFESIAACKSAEMDTSAISVFSPFAYDMSQMKLGEVGKEAGRCATQWVIEATKLASAGEIDGIVTAPLNKEAMYLAGFTQYGGHTEILQQWSGAKSSSLCLYANGFTVAHATCHIPFREISTRLTSQKIVETCRILRDFLLTVRPGVEPRIAMAGLNPHCEPIFGDEETVKIQPAIDQVRGFGWKVHKSPVPPDTCFLRLKKGEWDAVIAMYHDQGHIPAKMEGFGGTVNVTLGLPIVRTSVDHGTAFDIAGKGIADEENIFQAVTLGATMARGRKQTMGKRKRE